MKTLSCKDLGAAECDFVAKAETAEECVKIMGEHAMSAHADKADGAMTPDQMTAMMMGKVKDEA